MECFAVSGQSCQEAGGRRSNICTQKQGVDGLQRQDPQTDQRSDGGREHRAGLDQEGEEGADDDDQITVQVAYHRVREGGVKNSLDGVSNRSCKIGIHLLSDSATAQFTSYRTPTGRLWSNRPLGTGVIWTVQVEFLFDRRTGERRK